MADDGGSDGDGSDFPWLSDWASHFGSDFQSGLTSGPSSANGAGVLGSITSALISALGTIAESAAVAVKLEGAAVTFAQSLFNTSSATISGVSNTNSQAGLGAAIGSLVGTLFVGDLAGVIIAVLGIEATPALLLTIGAGVVSIGISYVTGCAGQALAQTIEAYNNQQHPAPPGPNPPNPPPGGGPEGPYGPQGSGPFNHARQDPLVIDVAGTGLNLTAASSSSPYFVWQPGDAATQTGWIGSGTGFLVLDTGASVTALNLFGPGQETGFAALAALDSNGDGVINASDADFGELGVWQDLNGNGVADPGEVKTLSQLGIVSISLSTSASSLNINGNTVDEVATATFTDGSQHIVGDAAFSSYSGSVIGSAGSNNLPLGTVQLVGYGSLSDLVSSEATDAALTTDVQTLLSINPTDYTSFDQALQNVLYEWGGVSDVMATSRGTIFDGQKLGFLEAFLGESFSAWGSTDPRFTDQSQQLSTSWDDIFSGISSRVLIESSASPFSSLFTFDPTTDNITPVGSIGAVVGQMAATASLQADPFSYWVQGLVVLNDYALQANSADVTGFLSAFLPSALPTGLSPAIAVAAATGNLTVVDSTVATINVNGTPTLWGSSGSDLMLVQHSGLYVSGQGGSDDIVIGTGVTNVEINEDAGYGSSTSTTLFVQGDTTASDWATLTDPQGDVTLVNSTTDQSIKLDRELPGASDEFGVAAIIFADGSEITQGDLAGQFLTGAPGSTACYGTGLGEVIDPKGYATYVQGNGGADTFIYNPGYGQVEIDEDAGYDIATTAIFQVGGDLTAADMTVSDDSSGDVTLTDGISGDQIKIDGQDLLPNGFAEYGVTAIEFSDGTSITAAQLRSDALTGNANSTSIYGFSSADVIDPAGYANYIQGNGGADTFIYGNGYGQVEINQDNGYYGPSNSIIRLKAGITVADLNITGDANGDILVTDGTAGDVIKIDGELNNGPFGEPEYGIGAIDLADGTSLTRAQLLAMAATGSPNNTALYGTPDADVIDSEGYATFAQGNGDADTFIYNPGYGDLEINEDNGYTAASSAVLALGSSIDAADLIITGDSSGDIIVTDGINGDQIKLDGELNDGPFGAPEYGVGSITLADGTIITRQQLLALSTMGSLGNTRLYGTPGGDVFDSEGYAHYAQGNGGADTFFYNAGYGLLEINDDNGRSAASAIIQFGAGITASDVTISNDGSGNMVITDGINGDQVTVENEFNVNFSFFSTFYGNPYEYGVAGINFADGSSLTRAQLTALSTIGSAGNTRLYGTQAGDTFDPRGYANYAQGEGGQDTFIYNAGYGNFEIDENAGYENSTLSVLQLGPGITASDLTVSEDASGDLTIADGTADDQIVIDQEFNDEFGTYAYGVATVQFADGTTLTRAQLEQMTLTGSPTNTRLYGSAAAELIDPAGYATYAQGGGGADTFIYNPGYGNVEINEDAGYANITDAVLQLGGALSGNDIGVSGDADGDIILTDGVSGDSIKLDYEISSEYGVGEVTFSDGTFISQAQLLQDALVGSPTNTTIYGYSFDGYYNDYIDPKGFARLAYGSGTADTFVYNAGYGRLEINDPKAYYEPSPTAIVEVGQGLTASDFVASFDGSGTVTLTDGIAGDELVLDYQLGDGPYGQVYGVASIQFADGTSITAAQLEALSLIGSPTNTDLVGTSGADLIDANGYAHYVQGNGGADTFVYQAGYGQLTVNEDAGYDQQTTAILQVSGNLTASDVSVSVDSSGDVFLTDGVSGDSVELEDELSRSYSGIYEYGVASVEFADGTSITEAQMQADALRGSPTNTTLIGTSGADLIDPNGYATYAEGNGGADTFIYNPGYGQVEVYEDAGYGNSTSAVVQAGGSLTAADMSIAVDAYGDVTLYDGTNGDALKLDQELQVSYSGLNETGVAAIQFADGTSITQSQLQQMALVVSSTNSVLYGTPGADVLDSKGLATEAIGNGGADTFIYNPGYGALSINEYANYGSANTSVLQLGGDLTANNVSVSFDSSGDAILTDGTPGDQIDLSGEIAQDYSGGYDEGVSAIVFSDGSSISQTQLAQEALTGSPTNQVLYGTTGPDVLDPAGYAAYAQGNGGNDTFIYNPGYGSVTINETGSYYSPGDAVLEFEGGLTANNLAVSTDSNGDIILTDGVPGDQVTLEGEVQQGYFGYMDGVQSIQFSGGTSISQAQLAQDATVASSTNTTLYGTNGADLFDPTGFAHLAIGNGGTDTFIYDPGYGNLEINENAGYYSGTTAVLQIGGGLSASNLQVGFDSNGDAILTDGVPGDQIMLDQELVQNYYGQNPYGVESINFSDGSSISQAQLQQMALTGTSTNSVLYGTSGSDVLDSGGFARYAQGNGGADTYIFNQGYGDVEINNAGSYFPNGAVQFGSGITDETIWFEQSGQNLVADLLGSQDQLTIDGWFASDNNKVADFTTPDGLSLTYDAVGQLVQAMATYASDNASFSTALATSIPPDATLQAAVSAAWHH